MDFKVRSRQRRNRRGKDPEGLALPSARNNMRTSFCYLCFYRTGEAVPFTPSVMVNI
jgi:hypothetical protein